MRGCTYEGGLTIVQRQLGTCLAQLVPTLVAGLSRTNLTMRSGRAHLLQKEKHVAAGDTLAQVMFTLVAVFSAAHSPCLAVVLMIVTGVLLSECCNTWTNPLLASNSYTHNSCSLGERAGSRILSSCCSSGSCSYFEGSFHL